MWQVSLPLSVMADVIAIFIFILHYQNMHITVVKADVVYLVEVGKSTFCEVSYVWYMLLPGGRWNTTRVEVDRCYSQVADRIVTVLCYF